MEMPRLSEQELHIWILPVPEEETPEGKGMRPLRFEDFSAGALDASERARAERFRFPNDQRRFAMCRSALRHLAGSYAGLDPASIRFDTGEHGKPFLAKDLCSLPLQFNLSHTRGMGVFAFVLGDDEVGIDVENSRRPVNELELGARVFTPGELATLEPLDARARRERFFAYWTAKEAFLKATGFGLSLDPRKVEATLPDDESSSGHFRAVANAVDTSPWNLRSFCRNGDFRISLASPVRIMGDSIRVFNYADLLPSG